MCNAMYGTPSKNLIWFNVIKCNILFKNVMICHWIEHIVKLKRHQLRFLSGKFCFWKLKKDFDLSWNIKKIIISKTNTFYFKNSSFGMQLNHAWYQYIFARKLSECMIEWRFSICRECLTPFIAFQTNEKGFRKHV